MDHVNIFIKGIFIENMIFAYFLGMCSYLAISKTVKSAVGLGFAVIFVLAVVCTGLLYAGELCVESRSIGLVVI